MILAQSNDEVSRKNFKAIEMEDKLNYKRNQDVEFGKNRLILTAPNGTRYAITVNNLGVLTTVAL